MTRKKLIVLFVASFVSMQVVAMNINTSKPTDHKTFADVDAGKTTLSEKVLAYQPKLLSAQCYDQLDFTPQENEIAFHAVANLATQSATKNNDQTLIKSNKITDLILEDLVNEAIAKAQAVVNKKSNLIKKGHVVDTFILRKLKKSNLTIYDQGEVRYQQNKAINDAIGK